MDGLPVRWLEAPGSNTLWVHGVPDSADLWRPFLERAGGYAVDLPGFGGSGKPAHWPYSVASYERFIVWFADHVGLDRMQVVAHDWGAVALALGSRIERLVAIDVLPYLPGHAWPGIVRAWRAPLLGEVTMGFTGRLGLRRLAGMSDEHAREVMRHFDHGTQRAILKLFRGASAGELAARAPVLSTIEAPALVLWGEEDPFLPPAWAERIATALGGEAITEVIPGAGHWPWMGRQEVIERILAFLRSES